MGIHPQKSRTKTSTPTTTATQPPKRRPERHTITRTTPTRANPLTRTQTFTLCRLGPWAEKVSGPPPPRNYFQSLILAQPGVRRPGQVTAGAFAFFTPLCFLLGFGAVALAAECLEVGVLVVGGAAAVVDVVDF